jgi:hypothetical protein
MSKLKIIDCIQCANKRKILINAKIITQDEVRRSSLEYARLCLMCFITNILNSEKVGLHIELTAEDAAKLSEDVE